MKILCGTDFSDEAVRASQAAAQIARKLGDTIALVHVVEAPRPAFGVPQSAVALQTAVARIADVALSQAAESLRRCGVAVETYLREGHPAEGLALAARESKARMIVVSTHGRRGSSRWLIGSVAERTVQLADCPVLVFRGDPDGWRAWAEGERPLQIGVGVDVDQPLEPLLAQVGALRAAGSCETTFVQWIPGATAIGEFGRAIEERLTSRAAALPGDGPISVRVSPQLTSLAKSLQVFGRAQALDLLITGTHQRQGWALLRAGSVSRDLLRETNCPVLCVPLRESEAEADRSTIPALRTVLCPTDFSERANRAIPHAYSLAKGEAGVVVLCHVLDKVAPTTATIHSVDIEERLRALIPPDAELFGIATHVMILEGPTIAGTIAEMAGRLAVDAICMGSHGRTALGRTLLGSIAENVVHDSRRPVFIVR